MSKNTELVLLAPRSLALTGVRSNLEISVNSMISEVVGLTGLEPVTPRLSSACSNQLSYKPDLIGSSSKTRCINKWPLRVAVVELRRVELLTYSLQSYRSTN